MPETLFIIVTGKVQGVFYRKSAQEKAVSLGLTGEICNRPDGSVQIVATGDAEVLSQFIEWCKQGPPRAVVDKVATSPVDLQAFDSFRVVR